MPILNDPRFLLYERVRRPLPMFEMSELIILQLSVQIRDVNAL